MSSIPAVIFAVITIFILLGCLSGGAGAGAGLYTGPYFPNPQPQNVTVHQNAVAYLPCTVMQLGDKSVSWVRRKDGDILTVDQYTFVSDQRLSIHFTSDTWTLVVKFVQERDAGTYECQVSTEPKLFSLVHLNVIVPKVSIAGAEDKYVRRGSTAKLECIVSSTVQLPDYIFWYHYNARVLEYDNPRVGISESRIGGEGSEMSVTSALVITDATTTDEGNYTCLPSNLHNATTTLHVLNDEHPAAMHTGSCNVLEPPSLWWVAVLVALVMLSTHYTHPQYAHNHPQPHPHIGTLKHTHTHSLITLTQFKASSWSSHHHTRGDTTHAGTISDSHTHTHTQGTHTMCPPHIHPDSQIHYSNNYNNKNNSCVIFRSQLSDNNNNNNSSSTTTYDPYPLPPQPPTPFNNNNNYHQESYNQIDTEVQQLDSCYHTSQEGSSGNNPREKQTNHITYLPTLRKTIRTSSKETFLNSLRRRPSTNTLITISPPQASKIFTRTSHLSRESLTSQQQELRVRKWRRGGVQDMPRQPTTKTTTTTTTS